MNFLYFLLKIPGEDRASAKAVTVMAYGSVGDRITHHH